MLGNAEQRGGISPACGSRQGGRQKTRQQNHCKNERVYNGGGGGGWKLEEGITTSGGKRGQEGGDKIVQFVSEIGGGDCPWLLRTGTSEAELPVHRLRTKCKKYSFALAVAALGHAVPPAEEGCRGCEQHGSVCPSDK